MDLLIDDISIAAKEAIEKAAAEAAKAAALEMLEREAVAIQEAQYWRTEAETAKKNGIKNGVLVGVICFLGGLAVGIGGTVILSN
ncbi:MAG: ABC transporter permease [Treponema sp.]|nr:ABC transporter permease [Treponema sp.]